MQIATSFIDLNVAKYLSPACFTFSGVIGYYPAYTHNNVNALAIEHDCKVYINMINGNCKVIQL